MAIDLSAISQTTTQAVALSNLALVTPQSEVGYVPSEPGNDSLGIEAFSLPSLLFHYEGENNVNLTSDITDHYVEDNTAVEDQIALKPEIVTVEGFIGELNDVPTGPLKYLKYAAQKLTALTAYTPELTASAQIAYANAFLAYQVASNIAKTAVNAWDTLAGNDLAEINSTGIVGQSEAGQNIGSQNKQQAMFQQFYGYWRRRYLFKVQTPWAVFQNMAIQDLRAIQDAETKVISSFKVTFKMIRTAKTLSGASQLVSYSGQLKSQASKVVNLGTSSPTPSTSLLSGISSMG